MAKATQAAKAAVSLKPSGFVQGGLLDDFDGEIISMEVALWDYDGKSDNEALGVFTTFQPLNAEGEPDGDESREFLSAGADFVPNAEGTGFIPTGTATALRKNSNYFIFLQSLCNVGFDEEQIDNDVTVFVGTKGHFNRIAAPKRAGLKDQKADATSLVCTSGPSGGPLVTPYAAAAPTKKGGVAAKKPPVGAAAAQNLKVGAKKVGAAAKAPAEDPIDARAKELLLEIVTEAGGEVVKRAQIRTKAFKLLSKEPDIRNEVLAMYADDGWMEASCTEAEIDYDGTDLAKAPA